MTYLRVGRHLTSPGQASSTAKPDTLRATVDVNASSTFDVDIALRPVFVSVAKLAITSEMSAQYRIKRFRLK
jgi:hypothetical protein